MSEQVIETRPFGLWTATALVVGGMIGAGIFVLPQSLAPYGWTGVAAWALAIAGALLIAYVIARLAQAAPASSGTVAIVGDILGPLPSVLVGWSYWIGIWSANAIIAVTAIRYLGSFAPALGASPLVTAASASALIVAILMLSLNGARAAGRFQVVTTLLKLLPLLAVAVIVIALIGRGGSAIAAEPDAAIEVDRLTAALTLAIYPLVGFEAAGIAAERVRDPARNVLRATLLGTALTGLLYMVVSSGVVLALPQADVAASDAPIALFIERYWSREAALAVAAFAVVAGVGCLNGWIFVQGELPLGMARAGLLPAWIGRTDARGVPVTMLLLGSLCSVVLIVSTALGPTAGLLDFMLNLAAAATLWLYVGICAAALRATVAPIAALLGLGFCAWALIGSGTGGLLSLALMLTALPLYWLRPRPSEQPAIA